MKRGYLRKRKSYNDDGITREELKHLANLESQKVQVKKVKTQRHDEIFMNNID